MDYKKALDYLHIAENAYQVGAFQESAEILKLPNASVYVDLTTEFFIPIINMSFLLVN